jgi:hypothetical protein
MMVSEALTAPTSFKPARAVRVGTPSRLMPTEGERPSRSLKGKEDCSRGQRGPACVNEGQGTDSIFCALVSLRTGYSCHEEKAWAREPTSKSFDLDARTTGEASNLADGQA